MPNGKSEWVYQIVSIHSFIQHDNKDSEPAKKLKLILNRSKILSADLAEGFATSINVPFGEENESFRLMS